MAAKVKQIGCYYYQNTAENHFIEHVLSMLLAYPRNYKHYDVFTVFI